MVASAIELQPYAPLNDEDCEQRIAYAKRILGERAVILGHHYQRDEVFRPADFSGDPQHLAWLPENLREGTVVNRISVAPKVAENARIALTRMLET